MNNPRETQNQGNGDIYISKGELEGKTKAIKDFCEKNKIVANELSRAYQVALGVESLNEHELGGKLAVLVDLLNSNFKNGYPLNRIAELIDEMGALENKQADNEENKKMFLTKLDEFGLSDKEKKLLLAIANQRRVGQVSFYKGMGGDEILRIDIEGVVAETDIFSQRIANQIIESVRKVKEMVDNGKVSIILDA